MAVLVKQLFLPLLEQLDRLLALLLQVLDEDLEVLVRVQQVQLVLQVMTLKTMHKSFVKPNCWRKCHSLNIEKSHSFFVVKCWVFALL